MLLPGLGEDELRRVYGDLQNAESNRGLLNYLRAAKLPAAFVQDALPERARASRALLAVPEMRRHVRAAGCEGRASKCQSAEDAANRAAKPALQARGLPERMHPDIVEAAELFRKKKNPACDATIASN